MEFIKRSLVGAFVGAIIGQVVGVLFAFAFAPRHWVTIRYVVVWSSLEALVSAVGGLLIGILLWVFHRRTSGDRVYKTLNRVLTPKVVQICWGVISGVILGGIGGMVFEVIVDMGRLLSSPDGMYFLVSDFTPVLAVGPVLGAIAGGVYGHVRKPTQKAVSGLIRGVGSGTIYGIGVGILSIISTCLRPPLNFQENIAGYVYLEVKTTIRAMVLGILIGAVSEMILRHKVLAHSDAFGKQSQPDSRLDGGVSQSVYPVEGD